MPGTVTTRQESYLKYSNFCCICAIIGTISTIFLTLIFKIFNLLRSNFQSQKRNSQTKGRYPRKRKTAKIYPSLSIRERDIGLPCSLLSPSPYTKPIFSKSNKNHARYLKLFYSKVFVVVCLSFCTDYL